MVIFGQKRVKMDGHFVLIGVNKTAFLESAPFFWLKPTMWQIMVIFGQQRVKNCHFVLSGVNKTAFFWINALFYIVGLSNHPYPKFWLKSFISWNNIIIPDVRYPTKKTPLPLNLWYTQMNLSWALSVIQFIKSWKRCTNLCVRCCHHAWH
jgi:hypothetical protein